MASPTFLGLDLSTQQLKAIIIDQDLNVVQESHVDFDRDLPRYATKNGVHVAQDGKEITAPVSMWLEALDLVLKRITTSGFNLSSVAAISGAGMQHGTIYWSRGAGAILRNCDPTKDLVEQALALDTNHGGVGALSYRRSSNWQDSSTTKQCHQFEDAVGGPEQLAKLTGSKAHHRFSGPQILKFRETYPEQYKDTGRISLVSSFLASVLLGSIAPIDRADAGGMNLQNIETGLWDETLLALVAGSKEAAVDLAEKLGDIQIGTNTSLGPVQSYFTQRYGFSDSCKVYPFTGDNPATILSLPLKENEAIISLGTSTTFLMSTSHYNPDPSYHFMHHPTTPGLYMFMLCYKNGSLAREQIRDAINRPVTKIEEDPWAAFNTLLATTPALGQATPNSAIKLALFFPRSEIVPEMPAGTHRALYTTGSPLTMLSDKPDTVLWDVPAHDARALIESQILSIRIRASPMLSKRGLTRIYLAGGGAKNDTIARLCGDVLGGEEGVWRLEDIKGSACARGAANRAAWSVTLETKITANPECFEDFLASKWAASDPDRITKVADGYKSGLWERYGEASKGMLHLEKIAMENSAT